MTYTKPGKDQLLAEAQRQAVELTDHELWNMEIGVGLVLDIIHDPCSPLPGLTAADLIEVCCKALRDERYRRLASKSPGLVKDI